MKKNTSSLNDITIKNDKKDSIISKLGLLDDDKLSKLAKLIEEMSNNENTEKNHENKDKYKSINSNIEMKEIQPTNIKEFKQDNEREVVKEQLDVLISNVK